MSGISEVGKFQHPIKLIAIVLLWFFSLYTAFHVIKNFEKPSPAENSRPALFEEKAVFHMDTPDIKQRKLHIPIQVQPETQSPVKHKGVCRSPECIQLAHQLHNWRDISVDPCQNFYQAVCGKYNEHTLVKGPRLKKKTLVLINLVQAFLQNKLPSESKSENSMRMFYKKCRKERNGNQEEIFVNTAREILELLMKVGIPPIFDENWDESQFHLNEMMLKMADIGWTDLGFFEIFVHSSAEVRIAKNVPSFTDAQAIGEEFFGFAANNGIELDQEMLKKDAEDMAKLTLEILKYSWSSIISDLVGSKILILKEIMAGPAKARQRPGLQFNDPLQGLSPLQAEKIPSIDIEKIVKALMNPSRDQKTWEKIRSRIVVDQIAYFFNETHNLETIIQRTPKRTLANFLALQIIKTIHDESVGKFSPFVDDCAATAVLTFPLAALRIFTRNHFDKENLQIASDMVEDIRESLLETFEESTWLQDETKKGAIKKLKMMRKVIGYPNEFEAPGALESFFEPLHLSESDSYFMTVIKKTLL